MNRPEKITVQVPDRKRNPVAAQLSNPVHRPRVIPSAKLYNRKKDVQSKPD
jgi:hypothetical protein